MNTGVSASSKPNIAEEIFREASNVYNALPELDPMRSPELLDEFTNCVNADDIMLALEKRITGLKDFRNDRWAKIREKLKPVVEVVLLVTKVVGDSAQAIGIPGDKGVFSAFVLLLAATHAQSTRYDTLKRVLEQLGAFLSRFKVLYEGKSSQRRPELDQIATTILAHLFYVLALSTKFLRESRIRHYLYVLGFPDDLKEALQKMDDLTKEEHIMMAAQTLVVVEQLPPRVDHIDENIEDLKRDFQRVQHVQVSDKVTKWLAAPDPSTDRNASLAKRQAGTGDWFLHTEAFKKWRTPGVNPVFWLHGQSGSGKTIISACVVDKLLRDIDTPDLAYFFFVTKTAAKESIDGLLSSTLLQLAAHQERHKILYDAYNSDKHIGPPSRSSLLAYFERMLKVPGNVILVIDALDEHPAPRDELLRFLTNLSCDHNDRLRLFVTSRNESDIRTAMGGVGAIEFDLSQASEQKEDIHKYITSVLESDEPFRTWTVPYPHILDHIKERLLQECMFRLVTLQLDRLRHTAPIDVEQTLSTFPRSLMEMYDHILQSMDSENTSAVRRVMPVFEIISCASRRLTVNEVVEVFAVEFDENHGARVLEKYRLQDPATELLRICTSAFIRIEQDWYLGPCVHFAHASVLDYFQRDRDTAPVSDFRIDDADSVITLAKLCLCTVHSMTQSLNPGPFDDYAHEFWLEETERALLLKPADKIKPLLDSILLQDIENIPVCLQEFSDSSTLLFASPLCCASYLGQYDYVQQILRSNSSAAYTICSNGWTALHCAASRGHIDIAQVIIEHRASVDEEDNYSRTPLHLASQNGYLGITQFLIERSAFVDKEDEAGHTPLHLASHEGYFEIVHFLLEHSASADKEGKGGQTPLHLAAQQGYLDIVQDLIKHSASVDKENEDGRTPLHLAAQQGCLDVLQDLIEHTASANKEDKYGQTPVHLALIWGYPDIVQLLIEHSASIDKKDENDRILLYHALQHGYLDIAQVLIESSASVDKEDKCGETPLHLASQEGYLDIVQVLIEHSASVDKEDENGRTPLHLASQNGHLGIVQVLIEHCASVDKEDNYGQTPIYFASQNGHLGIAQLLIDLSASIDKEDVDGRTPLHLASQHGHLGIAQAFIERHASVDKEDKYGRTAIDFASQDGHLGVAKVLLEHSASLDKEDRYGQILLYLASHEEESTWTTPRYRRRSVTSGSYRSSLSTNGYSI